MTQQTKKILAGLTAFLLAGQLMLSAAALAEPWADTIQGEVVISSTFTDPKFQQWLRDPKNLNGVGADGILTEEERLAVKELNLSGLGLSSLEGLEAFPNLEVLNCSQNNLTALDLSGNLKLTRLYCANNRLESLDLLANRLLEGLNCSFNRLQQLDLTGHDKLISLNCEMNYIRNLTLDGCTQLLSMYSRHNLLTELSLRDNAKLEFIETFDNQLESIDVSHLTELKFLHIDHNRLRELDMSHNTKLEGGGFVVRNNFAEKIYLPYQPDLTVYLDDYEEQNPIDGYDRAAWYLDEECTIPAQKEMSAEGQTLYSKRIPNRYTIYFSANGGNGSMQSMGSQWEEETALPPNTFTRRGYSFSHWSTLPNEDYQVKQDEEVVVNLAGKKTDGDRVTLYAQWKPNHYTIQLLANQGEGEPQEIQAVYGQNVTLPDNPFTRDGWEFAGWALSAEGKVRYVNQAQVQNLAAEQGEVVSLYAVWRVPVSEQRKKYLTQLEEAFRSYSASEEEDHRYTAQDWDALAQAYATAVQIIEQADDEGRMQQALDNGIAAMNRVWTVEQRITEVVSGWQAAHGELLAYIAGARLTEGNARQVLENVELALSDLQQENLEKYSTLTREEDQNLVMGLAVAQLQDTANQLMTLRQAAQWVTDLNGLTLRAMSQVRAEHLNEYQTAIAHYEELEAEVKTYISDSVSQGLAQRLELAGQKRSEAMTLQSEYDRLDLTLYSDKGKQALSTALQQGLNAIQTAGSVQAVWQARQDAWLKITQVPTQEEEEVTPPDGGGDGGNTGGGTGGGAGGGSGGGGGAGGGTGGEPEEPEQPTEGESVTVTDEKTGATAVVTTTAEGVVQVEATIPEEASYATFRIPYEGNPGAVAVQVEQDGSRSVIRRSVYRAGVLTVRLEESARLELVDGTKNFGDIHQQAWYFAPVQFAASRELFA
ncbi:MAG: InlB B-repeat-containing protein [Eubacteriales bacterium]|jgi:hypothetical protein